MEELDETTMSERKVEDIDCAEQIRRQLEAMNVDSGGGGSVTRSRSQALNVSMPSRSSQVSTTSDSEDDEFFDEEDHFDDGNPAQGDGATAPASYPSPTGTSAPAVNGSQSRIDADKQAGMDGTLKRGQPKNGTGEGRQGNGKSGIDRYIHMSKLEIDPGMDYCFSKRSPDIVIKEDPDDMDTLGQENGSLTFNSEESYEESSEVIFLRYAPSQQEFGQHVCALLNNHGKRGVLVIGIENCEIKKMVGRVKGIYMDRGDRDRFQQAFDHVLRRFKPRNPLDDGLVEPPVFKPVTNIPADLRQAEDETGNKVPMTITVAVRSPPPPAVNFIYDGHVYKRGERGETFVDMNGTMHDISSL